MAHKKLSSLQLASGLLLVVGFLFLAQIVDAQCGSQASTCKNCHEVQAQDPVNNDGTGWHESHAFGDFCSICHAGNQQATDKTAAHEGMVPPMEDTKAACQSCHASDLTQRVAVYSKILGVSDTTGAGTEALATLAATPISTQAAAVQQPAAANVVSNDQPAVCAPGSTQLAVDDPNLVDYVQHYNQVVLGEQPVNWGNIGLIGLIGMVVLGGGGFVVFNETRLHRSAAETTRVEGEYPAEVVEMLPALTNLKAQSRKSLQHILNHPEKSDKVLGLIDAVVTDDEPEE